MDDPMAVVRRTGTLIENGQTRARLRSTAWDRVMHGVRVPAGLDLGPVQLRVAAAVALMNDRCALGGWAALWAMGNHWFDGGLGEHERPVLVHCEPGSQLRVRPGIRPSEGLVLGDETIDLGGFRVVTPARAAYDEMCRARTLTDAVVAVEMAISTTTGSPHTSATAVRRVLESHHKVRGIVRAREAIELASSRSASPWETRTRMIAERKAGLEDLLVNAPIFGEYGELLGIADLLDEETGLVVESDGAHHREAVQHAEDNVREEGFERSGLVVARVTVVDHDDEWAVAGRLRAAHRDAARSTVRRWTLEPPPWWFTWAPARRWD